MIGSSQHVEKNWKFDINSQPDEWYDDIIRHNGRQDRLQHPINIGENSKWKQRIAHSKRVVGKRVCSKNSEVFGYGQFVFAFFEFPQKLSRLIKLNIRINVI